MRSVLIGLIRLYQMVVSPALLALMGPSCRFTPSCSQYAVEALRKYGAVKGTWFAVHRVCRCQPFTKGGYDPVP